MCSNVLVASNSSCHTCRAHTFALDSSVLCVVPHATSHLNECSPHMQRAHPEQRSEMPERISTANTVSQSNTTASGWGRLNAAAALEKAGSGARRLHSQASSNKSGHESWGELLTGLVTNPRQDTRGNLAPDQKSKFSVRFS